MSEHKNLFARRISLFIVTNFLLIILLIARMYYLQIYKSSLYKTLSDKNRILIKHILPNRGIILDSNNCIIANNEYSYNVIYDLLSVPEDLRNKELKLLSNYNNENDVSFIKKIPNKIGQDNRYLIVQRDINWNDLVKYYLLSYNISGLYIEKLKIRTYSYPYESSHFLGYTGAPTKNDINLSKTLITSALLAPELLTPAVKIGKNGIEKQYDSILFGKVGVKEVEVNSRRHIVRTIDEIPSSSGSDISLSININLQKFIYNKLSEYRSASCVVINIHTGAILALVSYPGYDINLFTRKITSKMLQSIYENPYKPLINKAISGLYSPGSTFKIITGLAALHYGIINKNTRFCCSGYSELGSHKFYCWKWKYGGHGSVNLEEALEQSCDCFFYNIANKINPDYIVKVANDFGLGNITGIDLPNEKKGLIPTKTWKLKKKKQKWSKGDSYNMVIGQGYLLTTPLQLARMTAIFANGLNCITPYIYQSSNVEKTKKLKYSNEHIQLILDGMYNVVNSPRGTARASATGNSFYDFSGKTGSSQVCGITTKQRSLGKTSSDIYEEKDHALFIALTPVDNPKYAISVVIEHGGSGAKTAAPIAKSVVEALTKIDDRDNI